MIFNRQKMEEQIQPRKWEFEEILLTSKSNKKHNFKHWMLFSVIQNINIYASIGQQKESTDIK